MARSCEEWPILYIQHTTHQQRGFLVFNIFPIADALALDSPDLVHLFPWNSNEPTPWRHGQATERFLSAIKVLPVLFSFPALDATMRCCPFIHRKHRCTRGKAGTMHTNWHKMYSRLVILTATSIVDSVTIEPD